jgi:hypothetical protein
MESNMEFPQKLELELELEFTFKSGMVAHAFDLSTQEVKIGGF